MILALDTGWKPREIGDLPAPFRAACHWAIFARAICGPEGLQEVAIPHGASTDVRLEAQQQRAAQGRLRTLLYPADE